MVGRLVGGLVDKGVLVEQKKSRGSKVEGRDLLLMMMWGKEALGVSDCVTSSAAKYDASLNQPLVQGKWIDLYFFY